MEPPSSVQTLPESSRSSSHSEIDKQFTSSELNNNQSNGANTIPLRTTPSNGNPRGIRKRGTLTGSQAKSSPHTDLSPQLQQGQSLQQPQNEVPAKRSKRRKVDLACVYCRRSHMTCDEGRPCSRCIRRNIGHLCRDEPKKKNKDSGEGDGPGGTPGKISSDPSSSNTFAEPSPMSAHLSTAMVLTSQTQPQYQGAQGSAVYQEIIQPPQNNIERTSHEIQDVNKSTPQQQQQSASGPFTNDWSSLGNQSILAQTSEFNQTLFYSEHANSEFASLGDFLSMIEDPAPLSPEVMINNRGSFSAGSGGIAPSGTGQQPPPVVSDSARDKFFLTAADPTVDISPEERLKQVIQAKLEAGLLQPFNYARGYARLQKFMDNYMSQGSKQRILKPLSVFRPAFRSIAQSLLDLDLVLVEEAFERMLLDYDRVFTSMAIPACLWRRTGEIYRGNKEFAGLVEVNVDELRDGKLVIYELMSEESAVNYWEKYGNIAFDSGQKAVLTSCNLRTRDRRKRRACCFSFTIQRDRYNM